MFSIEAPPGNDEEYSVAGVWIVGSMPIAEQFANARLIASAPELLSALIALAEAFEGRCGDWENADFNKVYRDAMSAIAKAKGGQA